MAGLFGNPEDGHAGPSQRLVLAISLRGRFVWRVAQPKFLLSLTPQLDRPAPPAAVLFSGRELVTQLTSRISPAPRIIELTKKLCAAQARHYGPLIWTGPRSIWHTRSAPYALTAFPADMFCTKNHLYIGGR